MLIYCKIAEQKLPGNSYGAIINWFNLPLGQNPIFLQQTNHTIDVTQTHKTLRATGRLPDQCADCSKWELYDTLASLDLC